MFNSELPVGIQSYCFRAFQNNAEVASLVKSCGVNLIELYDAHAHFSNTDASMAAIETYRHADVQIVASGVNTLNGDGSHDKPYFEFLKAADAKFMSVSFPAGIEKSALATIEAMAAEYDVELGIHNHGGRHWLGSPEILRYIFKITGPRIGLWLDTAWALDAGADPVAMVGEFGERLFGLHIKDFTFDTARRPSDVILGTGNLDLPGLAKALADVGFDGPAIIEYEGDEHNPVPALTTCVQEVRKAFAQ